jgi:hypothetical protein
MFNDASLLKVLTMHGVVKHTWNPGKCIGLWLQAFRYRVAALARDYVIP